MRHLRCKKIRVAADDAPSKGGRGFAHLQLALRSDAASRLGWASVILAGAAGLMIAARLLVGLFGILPGGVLAGVDAAVLFGGLLVTWLCWRGSLDPGSFTRFAILVEVTVAWMLATELLGWQDRMPTGQWAVLGTPRTGVWILFFATFIPLRPRVHLLGGLLSAAAVPSILVLSPLLRNAGAREPAAPVTAVLLQVLIPTALTVAGGYFAARVLYGLAEELTAARRMGSYQLQRRLGEGGMGEVWLAKHELLSRPAAIKFILPTALAAQGVAVAQLVLKQFEREVQATAALRSPHTIQVYDYGSTDEGVFYYVMEFLEGLDLHELIYRFGPLPVGRVVHILEQACHSLGEAHAAGLIHRDVKPANLFVCRYGREVDYVKVLDFGIVKDTGVNEGSTSDSAFTGTPGYAPPETIRGQAQRVGPRSDVYALACVAYWLLTGRKVLEDGAPVNTLMAHLTRTPKPVSQCGATDVPAALDDLLLRCLAKEPEDRVRDMDELRANLEEIAVACPWSPEEARRWWRDHLPAARNESVESSIRTEGNRG